VSYKTNITSIITFTSVRSTMKLTPEQGYIALHPIDEDREMSYEDTGNTCRTFSKIGLCVALLSLFIVIVPCCMDDNHLADIGISQLRAPSNPALVGPHHVPGWDPHHGDALLPHHPHAEPVKNDKGGQIITHHYDPPGPLLGGPKDTIEGRIHPPVAPTKAYHWSGFEARHYNDAVRHKVPKARRHDAPSQGSKRTQLPSDLSDSIEGMPQDSVVQAEIEESLAEEEGDVVAEEEQVDEP
jgi:hypothetical protein